MINRFCHRWIENAVFVALVLLAPISLADESVEPTEPVLQEPAITKFDRDHWAYKPIQRPAVPNVLASNQKLSPIDRFVVSRLREETGAQMNSPDSNASLAQQADRRTLIRRLHLDLLGVPPTPDQVTAFVNDDHPAAYRRMVDAALASPEYGQRWGQHWLDLARYAETDGFEHDKVRPTAWKFRDWVVDALNEDMPFDRFATFQIAGDLVSRDDARSSVATAFCLSGPDMPDINSQEERRHVLMNDITATIGDVFLSLQIGCAQCHDHKYDAISQADFYRMRAFFESSVTLKQNKSVTTLAESENQRTSHLMIRGDWRRKGSLLQAAVPRVLDVELTGDRTPHDDEIAKRSRADLAKWLVSRSNPITARSIVNRVWQHHFGRGLVATASDFGVMGDSPTHPLLLDYLASELIESGWSLKKLHRQIVTSSVYRSSSKLPDDNALREKWDAIHSVDPSNRLLHHFPRRRLDAEAIRDSLFAVSGLLDHEMGGPGVAPPIPTEMIKTLKAKQWTASKREADHYRRSIYLFARRNLRYPFFACFDRPTADRPCARRVGSITAVQSLHLLNSELTMHASRELASQIARVPNAKDQVDQLFEQALSRKPTSSERTFCLDFLDQPDSSLLELCRAVLNTNEFIYVD